MSKKLKLVGVFAVLTMAGMSLQATPIIYADFQSDTVGGNPAGVNSMVEDYNIEVVDGSSTPMDPFGGAGNQSLVIDGTDNVDWTAGETAISSGIARFSTKLVMSTDAPYDGTAYMSLIAGNNAAGSGFYNDEIAAKFYIRHNDMVVYHGAATTTIDNDYNNLTFGDVWNIVIDMDVVNQTWTVSVNDVLMTDNVVGSTFNFRNNITSINAVGFDGSDTTQRVFIDSVTLEAIPEPATIGLFGVAALVALTIRRLRA